jgi:hypothetical protein
MARTTYRSLKAGDLFAIRLDDGRCGVGNVLIPGAEMYICVYREAFPGDSLGDVPGIGSLTPYLIGRTSDELFHHGRWHVFRRGEPASEFPKPPYVVGSPDGQVLKSFDSEPLRAASEADLRFHGRQVSFSNITFANALQVLHGIAEATDGYDYTRLSYERACQRASCDRPPQPPD